MIVLDGVCVGVSVLLAVIDAVMLELADPETLLEPVTVGLSLAVPVLLVVG